MGIFHHTSVESTQHVRRVFLGVRGPYRSFKSSGEIMPVDGVRGAGKVGAAEAISTRGFKGGEKTIRKSIHEDICKIPVSQKKIVFQC